MSIGVGRLALRSARGAEQATNLAFGWHVGWQTSDRVALLLAATSSVYRLTGEGRPRRRGFETLTPTLEYRVADGVRLQAGVGLQGDTPVFYDVRPANPGERRFHHGVGAVLGAAVALRPEARTSPELRLRWNSGAVHLPSGRETGHAGAVLMGVRRGP